VEHRKGERDAAQAARAALEHQQDVLADEEAGGPGDEHLVDADLAAELAHFDHGLVDAGQILDHGQPRDRVDPVVLGRLGHDAEHATVDDAAGERNQVAVGAIRHRGRRRGRHGREQREDYGEDTRAELPKRADGRR
jgi:hypothetical protein